MLTHHENEIEVRVFQIDAKGYVRCGACLLPESEDARIYDLSRVDEVLPPENTDCGVCLSRLSEGPIFIQSVRYTLEHVACKIF